MRVQKRQVSAMRVLARRASGCGGGGMDAEAAKVDAARRWWWQPHSVLLEAGSCLEFSRHSEGHSRPRTHAMQPARCWGCVHARGKGQKGWRCQWRWLRPARIARSLALRPGLFGGYAGALRLARDAGCICSRVWPSCLCGACADSTVQADRGSNSSSENQRATAFLGAVQLVVIVGRPNTVLDFFP